MKGFFLRLLEFTVVVCVYSTFGGIAALMLFVGWIAGSYAGFTWANERTAKRTKSDRDYWTGEQH